MRWTDYLLLMSLTALSVWFFLKLVLKTDAVRIFLDVPDARKVHQRQVPRLGGFGILVVSSLILSAGCVVDIPLCDSFLAALYWAAAGVFLILGLLDDSSLVYYLRRWCDRRRGINYTDPRGWHLRVRYKLLLEFGIAGLAVYALNLRIPWPWGWDLGIVGSTVWVGLTLLWIVGVSNALNIIDGIDGLCGSVSAISMASLWFLAWYFGVEEVQGIAALCTGAAFGFLLLNFHPARLFLGDMGSLFLGFMQAVLGLYLLQKMRDPNPFALLYLSGFPVMDVFVAMVRRFVIVPKKRAGLKSRLKNMVSPDADHMHHRLLSRGLSHAQASAVLTLLAMIFTTSGALLVILGNRWEQIFLHAYILALIVITISVIYYQGKPILSVIRALSLRRVQDYPVAVVTGSPLLMESLRSGAEHGMRFFGVSDIEAVISNPRLAVCVVVEQLEQESGPDFMRRARKIFERTHKPVVLLSDEPQALHALIEELRPRNAVVLSRKPLYVHSLFLHIASLVGATEPLYTQNFNFRTG